VYYVLGCFGPADADRAAVGDILNTDVDWQTGARLEDPPPVPVQVELNPDFLPGLMMPMFDSGILLFSHEMLAALGEAGVDNLDVYDAVLTDPTTGEKHTNYKAVNIVGAIAAADLGKSEWAAPSGTPIIDTDFDSLAIDDTKTGGALMFRLAECVTAIVVHEKVRAQLEQSGIPYLDFTDPQDFVG
jgi:hypothetical protein